MSLAYPLSIAMEELTRWHALTIYSDNTTDASTIVTSIASYICDYGILHQLTLKDIHIRVDPLGSGRPDIYLSQTMFTYLTRPLRRLTLNVFDMSVGDRWVLHLSDH